MVNIGRIGKSHGYDGTVKIIPLGNYPERFRDLKQIVVTWAAGRKTQMMEVEKVRITHGQVYMKLKEISSCEEAKTYSGGYLQVLEEDVWPLPEGHYYFFQLEGLRVIDEQKGFLGILTEVIETGANNVYVVQREGKRDLLLPAIPQVIKKIDLEQKNMYIHLLPGLEEL